MNIPDYEVIGSGDEWITLLHGQSQHRGVFDAQVDYFRDTHRLLLIDLPGHGRSSHLAGPYGQNEYAQAVMAVLDAAEVRHTHLWGTHTGSAVSLLIACAQPDRVSSLILEGAVLPGMPMPYVAQAAARAKTTAQERGATAAIVEWFNECQWFDVIRDNSVECRAAAHFKLLMEFTCKPWLEPSADVPSIVDKVRDIRQPTLLVNGEFDVPEFLSVASALEAQLPHAQRAIVTGAGGFPLWEFPLTVNRLVDQFLNAKRID